MAKLVLFLIKGYQTVISPALPANTCRFYPSCSQFMSDAVQIHGVVKGIMLGLRRILRCHPFHPGGYDPVLPVEGQSSSHRAPARVIHQEPSNSNG